MAVTIYQGVRNADATLIKAAKVFDASDARLFLHAVAPSSVPYIFTAARLGLTTQIIALSDGKINCFRDHTIFISKGDILTNQLHNRSHILSIVGGSTNPSRMVAANASFAAAAFPNHFFHPLSLEKPPDSPDVLLVLR